MDRFFVVIFILGTLCGLNSIRIENIEDYHIDEALQNEQRRAAPLKRSSDFSEWDDDDDNGGQGGDDGTKKRMADIEKMMDELNEVRTRFVSNENENKRQKREAAYVSLREVETPIKKIVTSEVRVKSKAADASRTVKMVSDEVEIATNDEEGIEGDTESVSVVDEMTENVAIDAETISVVDDEKMAGDAAPIDVQDDDQHVSSDAAPIAVQDDDEHVSSDAAAIAVQDDDEHVSSDAAAIAVQDDDEHVSSDAAAIAVQDDDEHVSSDAAAIAVQDDDEHVSSDAAAIAVQDDDEHVSSDAAAIAVQDDDEHVSSDAAAIAVQDDDEHVSSDAAAIAVQDDDEHVSSDAAAISVVGSKEAELAMSGKVDIYDPIRISAETGAASTRDEKPKESAAISLHIHKEDQKGSINLNIVKDDPRQRETLIPASPREKPIPQTENTMSFIKAHGYIVVAISIMGTIVVLTMLLTMLYCVVRVYPRGRIETPKA